MRWQVVVRFWKIAIHPKQWPQKLFDNPYWWLDIAWKAKNLGFVQKVDAFLSSVPLKKWLQRLYVSTTCVLVGITGWKFGGWVALGIFALLTAAYERGRRIVSLDFIDAIKDLEEALRVPHKYKSYHFIYNISNRKNDVWIRYMEILPPETSMVAIKTLVFGAEGQGVSHVANFKDLRIHARASKGGAHVLPTGQTDEHQLKATIVMSSPIRPVTGENRKEKIRSLHITGIWPNLWAPLRKTGKDVGTLDMIHEAETLTISIIFPFRCTESDIKMEILSHPANNPGTITPHLNKEGRSQIDWEIQDAPVGKYKYAVECKAFPRKTRSEKKKSSKG